MSNQLAPKLSSKLVKDIQEYISEISQNNSKLINISRKYVLGTQDIELITDEMIVSKKFKHIKEAETVNDIKLIMGKPEIIFNGNKIIPKHKWVLPEEEIMVWSLTSLKAPLSTEGMARYLELFEELFPEKLKLIKDIS